MIWPRPALIFLLPALVSGCAASKPPLAEEGASSRRESLKQMDPVRIQGDILGFADRFVAAMVDAYGELERRTSEKMTQDIAHKLKTDMALGAISNAVNAHPITGLMDMVAMIQLQRQIAQGPWMKKNFGADAAPLIDTLKQQEADIHSVAARYLTDPQLAELTQLTEHWYRTHPDLRYVSHLHLAGLPVPNVPPVRPAEGPGSVFAFLFKPSPTLDPAVHEVELSRAASERMFFYLQRLPMLLQLQADDLYREMGTAPRFQKVVENVTEQRDATIRQMAWSLRQEQQAFVSNFEGAADRWADHLVKRLAVLALILLAIAALGLVAYRTLLRRRPAQVMNAPAPSARDDRQPDSDVGRRERPPKEAEPHYHEPRHHPGSVESPRADGRS